MSSKKMNTILIVLGIGIGMFFSGMLSFFSSVQENIQISENDHEEWAKKEGFYRLKDITEIQENNKHYIIYIDENMSIGELKKILINLKLVTESDLSDITEEGYGVVKSEMVDIKYRSQNTDIIEKCFVEKQ